MPKTKAKPAKVKTARRPKAAPPAKTADAARAVDKKSRVSLPKDFAGCTVLVERVGESELRIRKAKIVPEESGLPADVWPKPLSDRDWNRMMELAENPPKPNAALRRIMKL